MRVLAKFIYSRLLGWEFRGEFPNLDQYVLAVAPHTSGWDFFLGLLVRTMCGVRINYIGKKSLFNPPFGWFFRITGGAPVDRSRKSETVQNAAALFREHPVFRLALAPEGTRAKVTTWKSGFYFIALHARVPIVLASLDYGRKCVRISEPYEPSGDYQKDLQTYFEFYKGVRGKHPEFGFPAG